ncbi:MAG: hypothetical protein WD398_08465 [Cyclobacteriaceae bacterium]
MNKSTLLKFYGAKNRTFGKVGIAFFLWSDGPEKSNLEFLLPNWSTMQTC